MEARGPGQPVESESEFSPLRLWGLADRRLDLGLTLVMVAILGLSRLALLASGPWEWDETIFARGMLDFNLAAHFPQPPGFPGFLALGHLLLPLAGTPYRALQLVSALASILALWPLAVLGRRVATPRVATAAALVVLFLPGPWLYSVRGFSSTAAVTLALGAAALLAHGLEGRRAAWFTLLVAASFLVRPILLPTLALLWLFGVERIRPRRRVLPGLALGVALIAVAVAVMAWLEGGWSAFSEPFVAHASFHADRLHRNTRVLAELGLVKGVGGVLPALMWLGVSVLGLVVWARKIGGRAALAWAMILGVTVAQLLLLQNRSYARYAVGVQVASAPLLAGAASLVAPPAALAGLLGMAAVAAGTSYPLMREQHHEHFGAWQATVDGARRADERGWAAVVGPEVHVFSSYWWSVLSADGRSQPPMVLSPRAPEPWLGVDRPWVVVTVHPHLYWPSLTGSSKTDGEVSDRLRPLTQDRFLTAAVLDNPPLPIGLWWTVGAADDRRPFMWAGPDAELWLPPVPAGSLIGLELRPAPGERPLTVEIDHGGGVFSLDGRAPASRLWARTTVDAHGEPVIVRLRREEGYPPGGGDERLLAVQLLDVIVRPPGAAWGGAAATESDREGLRIELEGAYGAERFPDLGWGVWLEPDARFRVVVDEPGVVAVRLAAPRPTPANPRGLVDREIVAGPLEIDSGEAVVEISVDVDHAMLGFIEFTIESDPYRPADTGGRDTRKLGVVLLGLDFRPENPTEGWWNPG